MTTLIPHMMLFLIGLKTFMVTKTLVPPMKLLLPNNSLPPKTPVLTMTVLLSKALVLYIWSTVPVLMKAFRILY